METENNKEESNNEGNNNDTEPYRAEAGSGQDRRIRTLAYEQPYKAVLKMGLPVAFGMLFMVAYNLVDTYFIGMLHNDYQLAGASLAYPVLMVMIAISGIVGNGGASYIARCMGAARQEEAEKTLMLGFEMILVMSLLLTVLGLLFLDPVVTLLGAREETFTYTRDYTGVLLLGSFFRYSAASILSFLVDYAILSLIMFFIFRGSYAETTITILGIRFAFRALVAAPIARLCSAPVNFLLNKNYAFRIKESRGAVKRYIILAAACLVATTVLFGFFDTFVHSNVLHILLKVVIDVGLYIFNYRIQRNWVFRSSAGKEDA